MKFKFFTTAVFFAFGLCITQAQERKTDTLDNQVVNVIKPYQPTISDAFKIKDTPQLTDSASVNKKPVAYSIFSIPVASTFTPAKGKAATVDKAKPITLYDNYAAFGAGNYTAILGELYVNHELSNSENVGAHFSHQSSQGGIDGVALDNAFYQTALDAYYASEMRNFNWKASIGANYNAFNWYGVPNIYTETTLNSINPVHTFTGVHAGAEAYFDRSMFETATVKLNYFTDDDASSETHAVAATNLTLPVLDEAISVDLYLDYLSGRFERSYQTTLPITYGNFMVGISPSYKLQLNDFNLNIGAKVVYFSNSETSENDIFIYPNIDASYSLIDDTVIAFAGIKGGLLQNTYREFANQNPFVASTLEVNATDNQYNGFLGVKGKLNRFLSYTVSGSYSAEQQKALFRSNLAVTTLPTENYQLGNSFGVVYDKVNTLAFTAALNFDVSKNLTIGVNGSYFNYNTDLEQEAWNLPNFEADVLVDYQIAPKWFAGANVFVMGSRFDTVNTTSRLHSAIVELDAFIDANLHVGYRINDRFSVLGKVNNIVGNNYQRWANYPVQGLQAVLGATYQFDF